MKTIVLPIQSILKKSLKTTTVSFGFMLLVSLCACGQKGQLYIPESEPLPKYSYLINYQKPVDDIKNTTDEYTSQDF